MIEIVKTINKKNFFKLYFNVLQSYVIELLECDGFIIASLNSLFFYCDFILYLIIFF